MKKNPHNHSLINFALWVGGGGHYFRRDRYSGLCFFFFFNKKFIIILYESNYVVFKNHETYLSKVRDLRFFVKYKILSTCFIK